jgi:hypothetical protein
VDHRVGEALHQRRPVDGMNQVGVCGDRTGLVALKLSYEVPAYVHARRADGGRLRGRLLVAVLPHVGDAERG